MPEWKKDMLRKKEEKALQEQEEERVCNKICAEREGGREGHDFVFPA